MLALCIFRRWDQMLRSLQEVLYMGVSKVLASRCPIFASHVLGVTRWNNINRKDPSAT